MSPQSALAERTQVVPERTQAARIVFDRLPIESVPAFPVGRPLRPLRPLRLVPLPASVVAPMPAEVAAPGTRVRLTLRGRLVLIVLAALLLSGIGVLAKAATSSASGPAVTSHAMITVQPGDTLWSIATKAAPNADPRATVQRIVDLNGMSGTAIASGEQLRLP
jgi:LysM repeat protein